MENIVTTNDSSHEYMIREFEDSVEQLADGHALSARDRDYYDGIQHTHEEIKKLNERGQPVSTSNHILRKINFILGSEMRERVDPIALPITRMHEHDAWAATDAVRSVCTREKFDWVRSDAFENMVIEGYGGILVDPEVVERDGVPDVFIRLKHIYWDRLIWDYRSRRKDFSDARWVGYVVWMHLDDAIAQYPKAEQVLRDGVSQSGDIESTYDDKPQQWAQEDRVRVFHRFYKQGGEWYEAVLTEAGWIHKPIKTKATRPDGKTFCRLVIAAPWRTQPKDGTNEPAVCYGVVRQLISPQDDINKRQSKSLHQLTMSQIHAETGALEMEPNEALEEVAKPDGYISYAPGALVGKKAYIDKNLDVSQGQSMLLQLAKQEIDTIGPSAPVTGADQRVRSGRAELARQSAGSMELEPLYEQVRRMQHAVFVAIWYFIRKYWPEERWCAVRDDMKKSGYRFVSVNRNMIRAERFQELLADEIPMQDAVNMVGIQPVIAGAMLQTTASIAQQTIKEQAMLLKQAGQEVDEGQLKQELEQTVIGMLLQHPLMGERFRHNDVSELDVDITIDVVPDTTVVQDEEFNKLAEMARSGVPIPPKAIVMASNLRNKMEIAEMIQPPPDPIQKQMAQIRLALAQVEVEKAKAEVAEIQAHAQERIANAQFKAGPMAAKTNAGAMESAANAGSKTAPEDTGQGEIQ